MARYRPATCALERAKRLTLTPGVYYNGVLICAERTVDSCGRELLGETPPDMEL